MKRYPIISLFISGFVAAGIALASSNVGFKGIYLGQSEADLPKTLNKLFMVYEGVHEGDYFKVTVIKGVVDSFRVVYVGETLDRAAISKPIPLSQALREHSLSHSKDPKLAFARGNNGQIWGLVDLTNAISYKTANPLSPDSIVTHVGYLKSDAPVLNARSEDSLDKTASQRLLSVKNDPTTAVNEVAIISPEARFAYISRNNAVAALTEQADKVIGRGKRTIALIIDAETWLGVDDNHSKAKSTFQQLRQFYRDFKYDFDTLLRMYEANKAKLSDRDFAILTEPLEINDKIKHKMTQLKAMGFSEFSPLE